MLVGGIAPSGQNPAPVTCDFAVHLNQECDPEALVTMSMIRGPFGGYSSYGATGPSLRMSSPQDLLIETTRNGQAATSLKAVVYCRGYAFALVDVPSLAEPLSRTTAVALVPLPTLSLRGRILLPTTEIRGQFTLELSYDASQMVFDYFQRDLKGSIGGSFPSNTTRVATADVSPDGSFAVRVPDFLHDPAVAAARRKGSLLFSVLAPGANYSVDVVAPDGDHPDRLELAGSYDDVVLQVHPLSGAGR